MENVIVEPEQVVSTLEHYFRRLRSASERPDEEDNHVINRLEYTYSTLPDDQLLPTVAQATLHQFLQMPVSGQIAELKVNKIDPDGLSAEDTKALLERLIEIDYIMQAATRIDRLNRVKKRQNKAQ